MILVNAQDQYLVWAEEGDSRTYKISTASAGIGQTMNSFQTPAGWHYVADKIGDGCAEDVVFKSRKPLSQSYMQLKASTETDVDWIMARIIRLAGCMEGFNQGGECDTYDRMIYIHGVPEESHPEC